MKKLAAVFMAGVLALTPAEGVLAAEFEDGQSVPVFSSGESILSSPEESAGQEEVTGQESAAGQEDATGHEPAAEQEESFTDSEDIADVSDTPELSAINDRFVQDSIRYKEIAPGKVQLQDGSEVSGNVTIPEQITAGEDGKTYTVVSIAEDAFYENKNITGVTFPDTIDRIGPWAFRSCESLTGVLKLPKGLKSIGEEAFSSCTGLTGVILPEGLESIGEQAFISCTGITGTLTLPEGLKSIGAKAFFSCTGLTGLIVSKGVTSIGSEAFSSCTGLTGNLTLPEGLTHIGEYAFYSCGFDGTLTLPEDITSIGLSVFEDCGFTGELKLPPGITEIGESSFSGSSFTGNLILPEGLQYIRSSAFRDCTGFAGELKLPESLIVIERYAFRDCTGFTGSLTLPNNVTALGNSAFSGCTGFKGTLTLSESLINIGLFTFSECSGFTGTVVLPASLKEIGASAFFGCVFTCETESREIAQMAYSSGYKKIKLNGEDFAPSGSSNPYLPAGSIIKDDFIYEIIDEEQKYVSLYSSLVKSGELVIPEAIEHNGTEYRVTDIGSNAFFLCDFTGELKLPESITSIGEGAFEYCTGFTGELTLPKSLTKIGDTAFLYCIGFTGGLTLPEGVTSIGDLAFSACSGFTGELKLPESLTSIGKRAFSDCSGFTGGLKVPESVASIGGYAFSGCSGFTGELTLPEGLTSIGEYAFAGCGGFTGGLALPEGLTSIGDYTFLDCSGFTGELTLPQNLTSIGYAAFYKCGFTGELKLPESLTSIGDYAFSVCSGFTGELKLPERLVNVGIGAFRGCSGFTGELRIPESVVNVGNSAFWECDNIAKIHVGSGVETLTLYSFPPSEEMTTTSPRVQLLLVEILNREKRPTLLWDGKEDVLSGAIGTVDEDITIYGNITIEEGAEIRVLQDRTVTVAGNLINHGTLILEENALLITAGTFTDEGTVKGSGSVVPFGKPVIQEEKIKINGNKASIALTEPVKGAEGYDYIISQNPDCLQDRDYLQVNRNKPDTNTTFLYLPKGISYGAVHAWVRGADGKKVFGPWSELVEIKITADTPAAPKIRKVEVSGSTVKVTYTKSAKAKGYDLILGKAAKRVNKEMRPVNYGTLVRKVKNENTVTAIFKNVPKGTYYAGLHAWNRTSENGKKVFSKWSDIKKAVVK